MVVVIDNYDSFTYNLVQRLGEIDAGIDIRVFRNDELSVQEIDADFALTDSCFPGSLHAVRGGDQCRLRETFCRSSATARRLSRSSIDRTGVRRRHRSRPELMHGKTDRIEHDNQGLFEQLDNPFVATRYHSLVIEPTTLPDDLIVSAWTDTGGNARSWACVTRSSCSKDGSSTPKVFLPNRASNCCGDS